MAEAEPPVVFQHVLQGAALLQRQRHPREPVAVVALHHVVRERELVFRSDSLRVLLQLLQWEQDGNSDSLPTARAVIAPVEDTALASVVVAERFEVGSTVGADVVADVFEHDLPERHVLVSRH